MMRRVMRKEMLPSNGREKDRKSIPAEKVWKAIGQKPLFGHHSGKKSKTFWACFMKLDEDSGYKEADDEEEGDESQC